MRSLKFRVWDDDVNDWHATKALTEFTDEYNKGYNFNIVCFGNPERAHIEQYTGLKDKNGKEIYEGDIVDDGYSRNCEIRWSEKYGGFKAVNEKDGYGTNLWFVSKYGEVIGNIHENPELLEEEK